MPRFGGFGGELPFLHGSLPLGFERRVVALAPGRARAFRESEWSDTLAVVEVGRVELESTTGVRRCFWQGAVLCLTGLRLRALRNPGRDLTVLVAVRRWHA